MSKAPNLRSYTWLQ